MIRAAWLWLVCALCVVGCLRLQDKPDTWPCAQNSDCVSPNICRSRVCVDPDACQDDYQCGSGRGCVSNECRKVACTSSATAACSPYTCGDYACRTSCAATSDCQAGFACRDGACVAAECGTAPATKNCSPYSCLDYRCLTSCTKNADCADTFACLNGACQVPLKALGDLCDHDEQCTSGVCCADPGAALTVCAELRCTVSGEGGICAHDDQCSTKNCVSGACQACNSQACIAALCGTVKCGVFNGVNCGTCTGELVCNNGSCVAPCAGRECGEDHGVTCGSCPEKQYCDPQGKCQSACGDHDCGYINGTDCGTCPAKSHCDGSVHCAPACDGIECGTNFGVSCGDCPGNDQACSNNLCVAAVCPPQSSLYCKGNDVWDCKSGLSSALSSSCGKTGYCVASGESAVCKEKCTPGQAYCDGSVYGTCAADGKGQVAGGKDCDAAGLQCSVLGCESIDGVGACVVHSPAWAVGNVYSVAKTVTLDRFAQIFAINSGNFFVYESTTQAGPYTQIASQPASFSSEVVIQYSPTLNVQLVAGRFYILGVAASKSSVFCTYENGPLPVSFGSLLGQGYSSNNAALPTTISNPTGLSGSLQYVLTVAP